jgi:hypothetical protein
MKANKRIPVNLLFIVLVLTSIYLAGCSETVVDPANQTDDEYVQTTAIQSAYSSNADEEDNLFASEVNDFDSEGPVPDGEGDSPIDSLVKWGRRVTGVTINASITFNSDTLKDVEVTRTISGNYYIIGYTAGVLDTTVKPYTQEQKRLVTFKRVGRRPHPRHNWRVYKFSAVDGQTTSPQAGKDNITMIRVELSVNNNIVLTLNGPDFTSNIFRARLFQGSGMFEVNPGDEVKMKVYLTSSQLDPDIVAFHWARNSFGFHRERFAMTSQTSNGSGFERIYEKTFTVYNMHHRGIFNGYISSSTNSSLYDDNVSLFSSTYMGIPYRVRP